MSARLAVLVLGWVVGTTAVVPPAALADQSAGVAAYEAGDYARAFAEWRQAAEQGDILAMRNLGQLYRWGKGVERDLGKAAEWYRKAAERGFEPAQLNLGFMYLDGQGVEGSTAEAARWFEMAATQRNPVAQYQLARLLEDGEGVPRDTERALLLYRLAAQGGLEHAKRRLAELEPLEGGLRIVRSAPSPVAAGELPQVASLPPAPTPPEPPAPPPAPEPAVEPAKPEAPAQPAVEAAATPALAQELPVPEPPPVLDQAALAAVAVAAPTPEPKVSHEPAVEAPQPAAAPRPEKVAAKAAAPREVATMAHLASYHDRQTAEGGWKTLVRSHPELRVLQPAIRQTEVPGKGTYFRLYAAGPRERLDSLCTAFKRQSLFCMLRRVDE